MTESGHHGGAAQAAALFAAESRAGGHLPVPSTSARSLGKVVRVDVVALIQDVADRLEQLSPDTSPVEILAQSHNGFGALTLAAAVLDGQSSSSPQRTDEYAAITFAVVAAHEHIADVIDEQLLDTVIDTRMLDLLDDAQNLRRIRASARWLLAAAVETAETTRSVLDRLALADGLTPEFAESVQLTSEIAAQIRVLLDGPTAQRAAIAEEIFERATE